MLVVRRENGELSPAHMGDLTVLLFFNTDGAVLSGVINTAQIVAAAALSAWLVGKAEHAEKVRLATIIAANQSSLDGRLEQIRAGFQSQVQNYSLYAQRKHEAYAELYKLLHVADGALAYKSGIRERPDFDSMGRPELVEAAIAMELPQSAQDKITAMWDAGDEGGSRSQLREAFGQAEQRRGNAAFRDAKNYAIVSALYLSQPVEEAIWEIIPLYGELIAELQEFERSRYKERHGLEVQIGIQLGKIRLLMRSELSRPSTSMTSTGTPQSIVD